MSSLEFMLLCCCCGMGCGSSMDNTGVKNTQHRKHDIRINIIEATSILDYEDTDGASSCRQTPVSIRQTSAPQYSRPSSAALPKQVPGYTTPVVITQQEFDRVSSCDRPLSPIPTTIKSVHKIHTDSNMNTEEVPLVL